MGGSAQVLSPPAAGTHPSRVPAASLQVPLSPGLLCTASHFHVYVTSYLNQIYKQLEGREYTLYKLGLIQHNAMQFKSIRFDAIQSNSIQHVFIEYQLCACSRLLKLN